jgi:cbb3-type cytochrome oxidase maturation protein
VSVLYIALPVALLLGASALWACILTIRGGQYDDLESPPLRILIDEGPTKRPGPGAAQINSSPENIQL